MIIQINNQRFNNKTINKNSKLMKTIENPSKIFIKFRFVAAVSTVAGGDEVSLT